MRLFIIALIITKLNFLIFLLNVGRAKISTRTVCKSEVIPICIGFVRSIPL